MNLQQHNLNHKNILIDDSCKETNTLGQVQTRMHRDKIQSTVAQTEVSQNNKSWSNKNRWLHLRSDVVNKTLLRAVKRFYSNRFKIMQKSIVKNKSKNASKPDILDVMTQFWQEQFECLKLKVDYRLLAQFMILFLNIKTKSVHKLGKLISSRAKNTLDCARKYSIEKFKELQKWRELKILIVKIYDYDLEEIFSQAKTMEMNRDRYIEAIEDLIDIYS